MIYSIYLITNVANGKIYVGATKKTIRKRLQEHFYSARRDLKRRFYCAIRKYKNFNFE